MSKAKKYIDNFPMPKEIEDTPEMVDLYKSFINSLDIVVNLTLEDVEELITRLSNGEDYYPIDSTYLLTGIKKLKL